MPHQHDSSHPTGISTTPRKDGHEETSHTGRSRQRKSNAAIAMRLGGASWGEIAYALGFPTPRAALVATERALEKELKTQGDRNAMRGLAGARLERLLRAVWPKAIDDQSPEQMTAVTRARDVIGDHRKLYGLDAPTEVIVHNPTQAELDTWVAQVLSVRDAPVEEADIIDVEEAHDALPGPA